MPKGGARPNTGGFRSGAGRKQGTPNRKNAGEIAFAEAGGIMPKFVILTEMRFHFARYEELLRENRRDGDWRAECAEVLRAASIAAEKASPYFHARLSAHKLEGDWNLATIDIRKLSDEQLWNLLERMRELAADSGIDSAQLDEHVGQSDDRQV